MKNHPKIVYLVAEQRKDTFAVIKKGFALYGESYNLEDYSEKINDKIRNALDFIVNYMFIEQKRSETG